MKVAKKAVALSAVVLSLSPVPFLNSILTSEIKRFHDHPGEFQR